MPTVQKKKIQVAPEVMAKLLAQQFVKEPPVYDVDEVLFTVPAGMYTVIEKHIDATATAKAWTCFEAKFEVNKKEITLRYKSGVKPDEDMDIEISSWIANRNWPKDGPVRVPKGKECIFVTNAAETEE